MIPKDPYMLVSWINTQLRDFYPSLDELCRSAELDRSSVEAALSAIDYHYNSQTNSFE